MDFINDRDLSSSDKVVISNVSVELHFHEKLELNNTPIYGVEEAKHIFFDLIGSATVEKVSVLCLSAKYSPLSVGIVNIGTEKTVEVCIPELLRIAILSAATHIIIGHNHPSGLLEPSQYDIDVTRNIGSISRILGINLIDSIIVSPYQEAYSVRQNYKERKNE